MALQKICCCLLTCLLAPCTCPPSTCLLPLDYCRSNEVVSRGTVVYQKLLIFEMIILLLDKLARSRVMSMNINMLVRQVGLRQLQSATRLLITKKLRRCILVDRSLQVTLTLDSTNCCPASCSSISVTLVQPLASYQVVNREQSS